MYPEGGQDLSGSFWKQDFLGRTGEEWAGPEGPQRKGEDGRKGKKLWPVF